MAHHTSQELSQGTVLLIISKDRRTRGRKPKEWLLALTALEIVETDH